MTGSRSNALSSCSDVCESKKKKECGENTESVGKDEVEGERGSSPYTPSRRVKLGNDEQIDEQNQIKHDQDQKSYLTSDQPHSLMTIQSAKASIELSTTPKIRVKSRLPSPIVESPTAEKDLKSLMTQLSKGADRNSPAKHSVIKEDDDCAKEQKGSRLGSEESQNVNNTPKKRKISDNITTKTEVMNRRKMPTKNSVIHGSNSVVTFVDENESFGTFADVAQSIPSANKDYLKTTEKNENIQVIPKFCIEKETSDVIMNDSVTENGSSEVNIVSFSHESESALVRTELGKGEDPVIFEKKQDCLQKKSLSSDCTRKTQHLDPPSPFLVRYEKNNEAYAGPGKAEVVPSSVILTDQKLNFQRSNISRSSCSLPNEEVMSASIQMKIGDLPIGEIPAISTSEKTETTNKRKICRIATSKKHIEVPDQNSILSKDEGASCNNAKESAREEKIISSGESFDILTKKTGSPSSSMYQTVADILFKRNAVKSELRIVPAKKSFNEDAALSCGNVNGNKTNFEKNGKIGTAISIERSVPLKFDNEMNNSDVTALCDEIGHSSLSKSFNKREDFSVRNGPVYARKRKRLGLENSKYVAKTQPKPPPPKYKHVSEIPVEAIKWALLEAATLRARHNSAKYIVGIRNTCKIGEKFKNRANKAIGGPEKQFALYWEELCHFLIGRRSRMEMDHVLDEFLGIEGESDNEDAVDSSDTCVRYLFGSRRMRALHNELIYALMRQTMEPTIDECKYASHVPTTWRPAIERVSLPTIVQVHNEKYFLSNCSPTASFVQSQSKPHVINFENKKRENQVKSVSENMLRNASGKEAVQTAYVEEIKHAVESNATNEDDWLRLQESFGRNSSVWIPCGNNSPDALPKLSPNDDNIFHQDYLNRFHNSCGKISLPDEKLSGGLLVDPKVRKVCKAQGLRVTEHAIWLLVIAVRYHASSILKRAVENTKSIQDGIIPKPQKSSGGMGSISSFSQNTNSLTGLLKSSNIKDNEKTYCINAFNIAHVASMYPLESGGSLNGSFSRLQWERCIIGSGQRILSLPPVGANKLKELIEHGYHNISKKRRQLESIERNQKFSKTNETGSASKTTHLLSSDSRRGMDPNFKSPRRSETKQQSSRLSSNDTSRQNSRTRPLRHQGSSPGRGVGAKDLTAMRSRAENLGSDQQGRSKNTNMPTHQSHNEYINKNSGRRSTDPAQIQQSTLQLNSTANRRIGQKESLLKEQRRLGESDVLHSKHFQTDTSSKPIDPTSDRRSSLNTQCVQRQELQRPGQYHHQQQPQQNHHQQQHSSNSAMGGSVMGSSSQVNASTVGHTIGIPNAQGRMSQWMMVPQGVPQHSSGNGIPMMNQSGLSHMIPNTRLGSIHGQMSVQSMMMYNQRHDPNQVQNSQNSGNSPARPVMGGRRN